MKKPLKRSRCPFCGARGLRPKNKFDVRIYCERVVSCGAELKPLWPISWERLEKLWNGEYK